VTSPADPATSATPQPPITPAVRGALTRYRVIAYVVGVMLLLLLFVAMPLKYLADDPGAMNIIGPMHGFLYVVYLLATFDLFRRVRWSFGRLVLIALAGTIPFLSFYAERKTTHELTQH
jgi:integral membrane protein